MREDEYIAMIHRQERARAEFVIDCIALVIVLAIFALDRWC